MDPRNDLLARQLLDYSTEIKAGEVLYLELRGHETFDLGKCLIRLAAEKGATPFWFYNDESIVRQWLQVADESVIRKQADIHLGLMQKAQVYIAVRGSDNAFDLGDIPAEQMRRYDQLFQHPVHMEQRVKHTRWVVLRYPNNAMAQLAEMPQERFADFYYEVCCADYAKMSRAQDRLVDLMDNTDRVRIVGPGTDLQFSILGIPTVKCAGKLNIPDGEVYTAPVRDSINGRITYNAPSLFQGRVYRGISFEFKEGQIISAECEGDSERLNEILDIDEGSRYVGEFALGLNPFVLEPLRDTLFDEKIAGSLHLTPGQCYDTAPNGNKSAIHWDLVLIQRPEYGGGEIWFDDQLIRKDGEFTDPELERSFSAGQLRGK